MTLPHNSYEIVPLRRHLEKTTNGTTATQVEEGEKTLKVTRIETISTGAVDLEKVGFVDGAENLRQFALRDGDILFSHINSMSVIGNSAAVTKDVLPLHVGMNLLRLRPSARVYPAFLAWCLKSDLVRHQVRQFAKPAINQASISTTNLKRVRAPHPDLPTQRAIADFLDRETARIDTLIEKKQRLVNVIAEKASAVVSFAIRGNFTTPDAQKCNDIDWMGEYPAHWKRLPLKALGVGKDAVFIDGDWIESKDLSSEGIRYLTTGNVGIGVYKEQGVGFISQDTFNHLNCTEVLPGDILISRLNPPIGRACLVPQLSSRMVTSVDNVIVRPSSHIDRQFIVHVLTSSEFFENTSNIARGTTMQRISRSALGKIRIPLPPLEEQREIARHVSSRTDAYRLISDKVGLSVDRLKEYRSALITSAVTGQIDVTKWTNAGTTDRQLDAIEEEFGA